MSGPDNSTILTALEHLAIGILILVTAWLARHGGNGGSK